jgi:hypothetical protein
VLCYFDVNHSNKRAPIKALVDRIFPRFPGTFTHQRSDFYRIIFANIREIILHAYLGFRNVELYDSIWYITIYHCKYDVKFLLGNPSPRMTVLKIRLHETNYRGMESYHWLNTSYYSSSLIVH